MLHAVAHPICFRSQKLIAAKSSPSSASVADSGIDVAELVKFYVNPTAARPRFLPDCVSFSPIRSVVSFHGRHCVTIEDELL